MVHRILSVAEMRDWEARTWASGIAPEAVIRRAGAAVGRAVRRFTTAGQPVLVLRGRGHNGDDAAVAAGELTDRAVTMVQVTDEAERGRAFEWLAAHRGAEGAWVVDGLFGIGLSRPIEGAFAELVRAVNASGIPVVAVDVPSGLDADTGEAAGPAIEAVVTVTLGAVKRGLIRESAARFVGRLELAHEIGLLEPDFPDDEQGDAVTWTVPEDFHGFPPRRPVSGHKGTFGHVALVAGSEGYHGAAVLAARGALRARPGLVTVFTDERCYVPVASQLQAAMVRPWRGERFEGLSPSALVLGPGLASPRLPVSVRAEVERLWSEAPCPVVADATALDWLPRGSLRSAAVRVITPHPGEAARLLGTTVPEVQADRIGTVRRLAGLWSGPEIIVVLKGRFTVIGGNAAGGVSVNSSGNSGLAQGGSGDVLAGYLGGLLAQPALRSDPARTARYGVWRHGRAADALEESGRDWTVEELVVAMG